MRLPKFLCDRAAVLPFCHSKNWRRHKLVHVRLLLPNATQAGLEDDAVCQRLGCIWRLGRWVRVDDRLERRCYLTGREPKAVAKPMNQERGCLLLFIPAHHCQYVRAKSGWLEVWVQGVVRLENFVAVLWFSACSVRRGPFRQQQHGRFEPPIGRPQRQNRRACSRGQNAVRLQSVGQLRQYGGVRWLLVWQVYERLRAYVSLGYRGLVVFLHFGREGRIVGVFHTDGNVQCLLVLWVVGRRDLLREGTFREHVSWGERIDKTVWFRRVQ